MFLIDALQQHATRQRFKPFLVSSEGGLTRQFSYAEALDETKRWANILARSEVKQGDLVFISLMHRHEIYFAFLGAMWIGAIPTIIPFPTPRQDAGIYWHEYRTMFAQVKPRALITYTENIAPIREALQGQDCTILDVDALDVDALDADAQAISPKIRSDLAAVIPPADGTALLQFSSGTTGLRKGVMLSHRQIADQLDAYAGATGFGANDVVASWLPLYHDMGLVACFLLPLHAGATIVSLDAFDWVAQPWSLLQAMDTYRATYCWQPNFAFQHIVRTLPEARPFNLGHMRAFVNCSETCRPGTMDDFLHALDMHGVRADQLHASYAMAETVFAVTQSPPGRPPRLIAVDRYLLEQFSRVRIVDASYRNARMFLSCGPVLPGLEVRITAIQRGDDSSRAADGMPEGIEVGEIEVRGVYLCSGYYQNEAATRAAFVDGWYKTGDIGFVEEGELFVRGRLKEVLIVHGRNYYANDIESIVNDVPGVKPGRAVAFGVDDARTGSEEAVVLAESEEANPDERAALQRDIKTAVFDRMELTLRSVVLVESGSLVKTTSGKLSRELNKTRYLNPETKELIDA